jgi:hypothetical protein
MTTEV